MEDKLDFLTGKVMSFEALLKDILANNSKEDLMGISETANLLGLGESTLYTKVSKKQIPHYKPGGAKVLFSRKEIMQFVKSHKILTVTEEFEKTEEFMSNRKKGRA